jgi:hypothetical protein
VCVCTNGKRPR